MARPRSAGPISFTRWPSICSSPPEICSRPAIMRSRVDLPQPDGPTNTTNSRSAMSRSMPLIAWIGPYVLRRPRNVSVAMRMFLLHGAEGQATHQLTLAEPAKNQDRRDCDSGCGGQLGEEQPLWAGERRDEGGQRRGRRRGEVEAPERLV